MLRCYFLMLKWFFSFVVVVIFVVVIFVVVVVVVVVVCLFVGCCCCGAEGAGIEAMFQGNRLTLRVRHGSGGQKNEDAMLGFTFETSHWYHVVITHQLRQI